jgi:cysteine-rich repeat protein
MKLARLVPFTAILLTATAALAQQQGPNHGGSVASCTFGSSCISAAGGGDHTCASSTGAGQSLVITNFGFDLPDNTGAVAGLFVEPRFADLGCQGSIRLVKDGTPVGTPVTLPSYFANMCSLTQYFSLGGSEDLWGTTWTAADIEDADFGVQIDSGACTDAIAVDTVRVTVHFTIGDQVCNDGYVTGDETCEDGNTDGGDGCSATCHEEVPLTGDQQKCVNSVNSGVAKVNKAASKVIGKCLKAHAKGGTLLDDCISSDETTDKIGKAVAKLISVQDGCEASPPPFGYTSVPSSAVAAYLLAFVNYFELVAPYPDDFVVGDKAAAACQAAVLAGKQAVTTPVIANFNKCKKAALAGKKVDQADSIDDLNVCLPAFDDGAGEAIVTTLASKCEGQALDELLSGRCAGAASDAQRAECLARRAYCYACILLTTTDGMTLDCDFLDNGAEDDSCTDSF